ncbi:MAG TPA: tetratricopeptide repeat protein [Blastocatellia bacterium]|nr:tetratricopeptide repeat protein [Blastocatellia bacterium]
MKKLILLLSLILTQTVLGQDTPPPPPQQQTQVPSVESVLAEQNELNLAMASQTASDRVDRLNAFIKAHPQSALLAQAQQALVQTHAQMGDEYLRSGNTAKGVEEFHAAFDAIPDPVSDAYFQQMVWNFPVVVGNYGNRVEAVKLMRSFEPRFWKEANRLMDISGFYAGVEDAPDALRVLERARDLSPRDTHVHSSMGTIYIMSFDFEKAEQEFLTALDLDPKTDSAYTALGHLARARGDYQKAADYYSKQIEISPEDGQAHGGLAIANLALGKNAEASAELAKTLVKNPNDFRFLTQLAYWYATQRDYERAKSTGESALRIEPRYPWARVIVANCDLARGQFADAEKEMALAKKYGQFPSVLFELGKIYARAGMFDDAVETWGEAIEVTPLGQFRTSIGGIYPLANEHIDQLLQRERQASLFFTEPLSTQTDYQVAEELLRFNSYFTTLSERVNLDTIPRYLPPKEGDTRPTTTTSASDTSIAKNTDSKSADSKTADSKSTDSKPSDDQKPQTASVIPSIPDPTAGTLPMLNPDYMFFETWQMRDAFQRIDGEVAALNALDDDRRIFRLIWISKKLADADLKPDLAISAARLAYDSIDTSALPPNSIHDVAGIFTADQQQAIIKARTEDALGWALFKIDKNDLAVTYLKAAAERTPIDKEKKEYYWHYGAVTEATGKTEDALELYFKGYDSTSSLANIRRTTIERLYQKVHGSLDGLNEKLGSKSQ